MSKRVVWLVAVGIGILATACVPVSTAPQGSNDLEQQALLNAHATGTAVMAEQQAVEATAQAAKENRQTDNEIRVIDAQVAAKKAEVDLQLTMSANDIAVAQAHVTQTAAARISNQESLDAQKKQVETQLEIAKKQRQNAADDAWNEFWKYGWPILVFFLSVVAVFLLAWVSPHIREQNRLWQEQRRRFAEQQEQQKLLLARLKESVLALTDGTKVWFDELGHPEIIQKGEGSKALPEGATAGVWSDGTPLIVRNVGGSVNLSKPRTVGHSTTDRCLELVNAAIQKEGVGGQVIPRFNNIVHYDGTPYYSEEWQELTGAMEADGLLIVISSGDKNGKPGTYLTDPDDGGRYENLGRLRDALQSGNQFVRPLRKAPSPSERLPVAGD